MTGSLAGRIKDRLPRPVLDLANAATRGYGVATARWRVPPDFLIVGTKRGGTTSLWNWLDGHPQVLSMFPQPRGLKSPEHFFGKPAESAQWYRSHFHTTAYRSWAARSRGPVVNGEASPYYMYGPHVPAQLAHEAPNARLIVLLRDPVERAYSHFQERTKQGVETLDFAAALAAEEDRIGADRARALGDPDFYSPALDFFSYRDRGIYLPQVRRIHAAFPREQVLIVLSEELYAEPQRVFDRTCEFLGITPRRLIAERHNEIKRSPMDARVRAELSEFFQPHSEELAAYLGLDLGWHS
jgi:hypothetical protein